MRLPRLLPKRRDPHTAVITGIKSAVRSGSIAGVRRELFTRRTQIGLDLEQTREISELIAGRVSDEISHDEASERFADLAQQMSEMSFPSRTWFTVENLSRTVGCFRSSYAFTDAGLRSLEESGNPANQLLHAIHRRDLSVATRVWNRVQRDNFDHKESLGHYLLLWSNGKSGQAFWSDEKDWVDLVKGREVLLMGPAPSSLKKSIITSNTLVGRVIMQNVTQWNSDTDPLGGQCDIAWASRETRNWLDSSVSWHLLNDFDAVSFRGQIPNHEKIPAISALIRVARSPQALLIEGSSPNMIPLAMWDVLTAPDTQVVIGGTTFFASEIAYTDSNRRVKHQVNKSTDAAGSTGLLFERCPTFARHNVSENLALVANLVNGGIVTTDSECERVIQLDEPSYLSELDTLYGIERL